MFRLARAGGSPEPAERAEGAPEGGALDGSALDGGERGALEGGERGERFGGAGGGPGGCGGCGRGGDWWGCRVRMPAPCSLPPG